MVLLVTSIKKTKNGINKVIYPKEFLKFNVKEDTLRIFKFSADKYK